MKLNSEVINSLQSELKLSTTEFLRKKHLPFELEDFYGMKAKLSSKHIYLWCCMASRVQEQVLPLQILIPVSMGEQIFKCPLTPPGTLHLDYIMLAKLQFPQGTRYLWTLHMAFLTKTMFFFANIHVFLYLQDFPFDAHIELAPPPMRRDF